MDYGNDIHLKKINEEVDKEKKGFAYRLGYLFATVLTICLMVVVIAVTYKFLLWLY